ncbi:hypothetical protein [Bradyrhizobium sp. Leaf401]|uniref:hypothetical protein n=1 Tax=Bradyrhizobium sp. Leaf401 TaxID=2876564 RepID=UPI001E44C23B|nr:hypothetical protein [Bradyrhizobium sp. Leaf401]
MRKRVKLYLRAVSRLLPARSAGADCEHASEASPLLILVAVVLALLLAILEIDLHSAEVPSLSAARHHWSDPINNP